MQWLTKSDLDNRIQIYWEYSLTLGKCFVIQKVILVSGLVERFLQTWVESRIAKFTTLEKLWPHSNLESQYYIISMEKETPIDSDFAVNESSRLERTYKTLYMISYNLHMKLNLKLIKCLT